MRLAIENIDCRQRHQLPAGGLHRPHRPARTGGQALHACPTSRTVSASRPASATRYDDWFPLACVTPFSKLVGALRGELTYPPTRPPALLARHLPVCRSDVEAGGAGHAFRGRRPRMLQRHGRCWRRKAAEPAHQALLQGQRLELDAQALPARTARREGLTFTKFLQTLQGLTDKKLRARQAEEARLYLSRP